MEHRLLSERKIDHTLAAPDPEHFPETVRAHQVHGVEVSVVDEQGRLSLSDADAVISRQPGLAIGVVTADCVPILVAIDEGRAVSAIHAGWRGLAAGVVEEALLALSAEGSFSGHDCVAVIGPHIGSCCYEVDGPVVEAFRPRYAEWLEEACRPSRPDHFHLDLGEVVTKVLLKAGFPRDQIGHVPDSCTLCSPEGFHSYRRDGESAGRMLHSIAASGSS